MNTKTKLLISGFIALSLVLSFAAFNRNSKVIQQIVGGGGGSNVQTNWFSVGGVTSWNKALSTLSTASSTACALQSPNATSTLISGGVRFKLASTSAVTVDLAKGTTQYATSTMLGTSYGIAASAQASVVASTTQGQAAQANIFAPNTWFLVRFNEHSGTSGAGNAPTGSCFAQWIQI